MGGGGGHGDPPTQPTYGGPMRPRVVLWGPVGFLWDRDCSYGPKLHCFTATPSQKGALSTHGAPMGLYGTGCVYMGLGAAIWGGGGVNSPPPHP